MDTSGGKRPGGRATTTTPVMPRPATAILHRPQWSLGIRISLYNNHTQRQKENRGNPHLSRKKDRIIVTAGLEKNMAVESPNGNLRAK